MSVEGEKSGAKYVSDEDKKRFEDLFNSLDTNKDGTVDIQELTAALKGRREPSRQAAEIMRRADTDSNAVIDLAEFVKYMHAHERKLRLAFTSLDRNHDGKIDPSEIKAAMSQIGVIIDLDEARSLTKKIDKNQDMTIDWVEWRDYFDLRSAESLEEILKLWRYPPMIDIGEQLTCPPDFPKPKDSMFGVSWCHLIAGGVAGAVSRTSTAPLDRLKVMLQVYGTNHRHGFVGGLRYMIQEGGFRSLWRGNGMSVVKIAPESAIKFASYEQIKKWLHSDASKDMPVIARFTAGSAAGAIAQTAIFPMEVVKTRLAVSTTGQFSGILDCAAKIFKKDGVRPFYRGYVPNIIGIVPYAGIDLTVYETLKLLYMQHHKDLRTPEVSIFVLLACGTVSSTCGQLASYPFSLVRTRLQAQATDDAREGAAALLRVIVDREGLRGLYRGLLPNFVKVLPAVSISYVVYERCLVSMNVRR